MCSCVQSRDGVKGRTLCGCHVIACHVDNHYAVDFAHTLLFILLVNDNGIAGRPVYSY